MKTKAPALAVTIVGFVATLITFFYAIIGVATVYEGAEWLVGLTITFFILHMIAAVAVFIPCILSLKRGEKSIKLGVLNIIFCSVPGGILYLIWNPQEASPATSEPVPPPQIIEDDPFRTEVEPNGQPVVEADNPCLGQTEPQDPPIAQEEMQEEVMTDTIEPTSVQKTESDPFGQLEKLKELLDNGTIDKETYAEKAKKYIDML